MDRFVSHYTLRLDAKGRVSIPASYRAVLAREGRVVLTDALKAHAGIADAVAFAGLGHKFQIWEPERFRAELAEATAKVRALREQLSSRVAAEGPHGARE